MGLMDVRVEHSSTTRARVEIDLGGGHKLLVRAGHDTDAYRDVTVDWQVPGHVTGPVAQVRSRRRERLLTARLGMRTGDAILARPEEA